VFVEPLVPTSACERLLLFPLIGAGTLLPTLSNCIVALRVYALYERNIKLGLALSLYILAEIGVSLWLNLTPSVKRIDVFSALGYPLLDDVPAMRVCSPQLSPKLTGLTTASSEIMLAFFDTVALALILVKSRQSGAGGLASFVAKQGLIYYFLNMALYVAWGFMLIFAPAINKYVMAGPALGLACVSVNRLTLHLRSYTSDYDSGPAERTLSSFAAVAAPKRRPRRNSWLGTSTLEFHDMYLDTEDGGASSLEMRDIVAE